MYAYAKKERSLMSVEDVYLLMLHEPYASSEHPVPINATIVHALTYCTLRSRSLTVAGCTGA
jgi:hypothetical protein